MQKVLTMTTDRPDMRASAYGWSCEDGDEVKVDAQIGASKWARFPFTYPTPLHAIGAGWRLLAPPQPFKDGANERTEWWFVRDDVPAKVPA